MARLRIEGLTHNKPAKVLTKGLTVNVPAEAQFNHADFAHPGDQEVRMNKSIYDTIIQKHL